MENFTKIKLDNITTEADKQDIYLDNEFLAISKFIDIEQADIDRLKKWEINEVYIKDESSSSSGNTSEDFDNFLVEYRVFHGIYLKAIKKMKINLLNFKNNNIVNINELNEIIDELIDLLNRNLNSVIQLLNIYNLPKEDEYFIRSLNVSIISMIIGKEMQINDTKLKKLGVGAALYDIGLVQVPDKIFRKINKFTKDEYNEVKKHTVYGYKIMKSNFRLDEEIAIIPLEHHEFFNGQGYPRGISGNNIHIYAKIVAIAHAIEKKLKYTRVKTEEKSEFQIDAFQANTDTTKVLLSDAIREILQGANVKYDPTIAKVFVSRFSVYPVGTVVVLNDNRKGLVFATNSAFPIRPIIKILTDENNVFIDDGEVVNLVESSNIFIKKVDKDINFLEEVNSRVFNV